MMLMLNVPATLGLVVLARPIVELLFERGRFPPADTAATAAALQFYAIGLVGYSAARIVSPTFYALRQSRIAVAVSLATIAVNVALSLSLVAAIGFRGLALATSHRGDRQRKPARAAAETASGRHGGTAPGPRAGQGRRRSAVMAVRPGDQRRHC